ncbi:hypothetical protein [Limosilactobacillus galli]|uniref:hypothetical protein n=1 Tax=Limosilactobacillus galli TaxID=2991834 RepID=UPI0024BB39F7|nr:hypothetical protein [Limosilactobacillus galli]
MKQLLGNIPDTERNKTMEKFNLNQVEDTNITLETVLGLAQTVNDLVSDNITLLTDYPSQDGGEKYQANRLATKLTALSAATIQATEKAQSQVNMAVNSLMEAGDK